MLGYVDELTCKGVPWRTRRKCTSVSEGGFEPLSNSAPSIIPFPFNKCAFLFSSQQTTRLGLLGLTLTELYASTLLALLGNPYTHIFQISNTSNPEQQHRLVFFAKPSRGRSIATIPVYLGSLMQEASRSNLRKAMGSKIVGAEKTPC